MILKTSSEIECGWVKERQNEVSEWVNNGPFGYLCRRPSTFWLDEEKSLKDFQKSIPVRNTTVNNSIHENVCKKNARIHKKITIAIGKEEDSERELVCTQNEPRENTPPNQTKRFGKICDSIGRQWQRGVKVMCMQATHVMCAYRINA